MPQNRPTLSTYLNLRQLLDHYRGTHEENRTLFLENEQRESDLDSITLLEKWQSTNSFRVTEPLESKKYLQRISMLTTLLGFFSLILGLFTGIGLLSYSGSEPVNVIYILFVVSILPLLSMTLSLLSMLFGETISQWINHLSPLFYIEKLFSLFGSNKSLDLSENPFSLNLSKWIFLHRVQLFSLLFYLGLFVAFLFMIVAKDIAFSWSTTLQITAESFHNMLLTLGIWWKSWLPSAIPSLELLELSHYFRLGAKLDAEMIANADKLGAWWKFLVMTTFVYAILFRFLFLLWSRYGLNKAIKEEILQLDGVSTLLTQCRTSFISTQSLKEEKHLKLDSSVSNEVVEYKKVGEYSAILGWNFSRSELLLLEDTKKIQAPILETIGGSQSYKEDMLVAQKMKNRVLIYVKSWEPPTMDFIDFLEELIEVKAMEEVHLYPVGIPDDYYEAEDKGIQVWKRKIQSVNLNKVGFLDE